MSYHEISFDVIFCARILDFFRHYMQNFIVLTFKFYLIGENLKFQLDAWLRKLINTSISMCSLVEIKHCMLHVRI
jgi:hypothetical protein